MLKTNITSTGKDMEQGQLHKHPKPCVIWIRPNHELAVQAQMTFFLDNAQVSHILRILKTKQTFLKAEPYVFLYCIGIVLYHGGRKNIKKMMYSACFNTIKKENMKDCAFCLTKLIRFQKKCFSEPMGK